MHAYLYPYKFVVDLFQLNLTIQIIYNASFKVNYIKVQEWEMVKIS